MWLSSLELILEPPFLSGNFIFLSPLVRGFSSEFFEKQLGSLDSLFGRCTLPRLVFRPFSLPHEAQGFLSFSVVTSSFVLGSFSLCGTKGLVGFCLLRSFGYPKRSSFSGLLFYVTKKGGVSPYSRPFFSYAFFSTPEFRVFLLAIFFAFGNRKGLT